ncbi:UNVERIFIED_CONTAM: Gamma carbonic anhydrase-like 2, mitochondrial [Sesamum radiatum]|uniref:Gamma carbonic anhydrase-like 2, mitochondrial n=1 Tax=Sesamum radiatum TaxID=300843 RepID=A0AAW2V673_SESRA
MATLARISRRILTRTRSGPFLGRAFSAEAVESTQSPAPPPPVIRESADRVRWDYRGQRKIVPLGQWAPKIAVDAYVAPNVVLAGQVVVYDGASVWNGAVLRGDLNKITVGFCSNVQEQCVVQFWFPHRSGFLLLLLYYAL